MLVFINGPLRLNTIQLYINNRKSIRAISLGNWLNKSPFELRRPNRKNQKKSIRKLATFCFAVSLFSTKLNAWSELVPFFFSFVHFFYCLLFNLCVVKRYKEINISIFALFFFRSFCCTYIPDLTAQTLLFSVNEHMGVFWCCSA